MPNISMSYTILARLRLIFNYYHKKKQIFCLESRFLRRNGKFHSVIEVEDVKTE